MPPELVQGFAAGLFDLPMRPVTGTSAVQDNWNIPILLVGFSDAPMTKSASEFEHLLFDSTGSTSSGSVFDYYRWASNGKLRIRGKVVANVQLPQTRSFYAGNAWGLAREATPQNLLGMTRDALLSCHTLVDWAPYDQDRDGFVDMLWVIHSGLGGEITPDRSSLWSVTSQMSGGWQFSSFFTTLQLLPGATNQYFKIDRFSSLPELSYIIPGRIAEIGTYAHEFGHALGLPDLYDTSGFPSSLVNTGPGNWSLMGTGNFGGNGLTPENPSHLGAWCQRYLGWVQGIRPAADTVLTLRPIGRGDPVLELVSLGADAEERFLVENRQPEENDAGLPGRGLLITHVDEALIRARIPGNRVNAGFFPAYVLVEGDGDGDLVAGRNRGDSFDPLPGATGATSLNDDTTPNLRTFSGQFTELALGGMQYSGNDVQLRLQVRPPGWQAPHDITPAEPYVLDSARPARWAVTDREQRVFAVRGELVGGAPQVVLRARLAGEWQPPEVISDSPAGALDPAIALLPGGDLAVSWTDVRGGRSQVYYRARIRGTWSTAQPMGPPSGDSHHPVIGADKNGMVAAAWIHEQGGVREIQFKRFAYFAPFGTPVPVTFAGEVPDPPALAVHPSGRSFVVWSDRAAFPPRLFFSRFHPDSGMSLRQPLTPTPGDPQLSISSTVDTAGTLHTVWQVAGAGLSEVHYQARHRSKPPQPADTLLVSAGNLVQNLSVAADDSGAVHLSYEDWGGSQTRVRYKARIPGRGWSLFGFEVSDAAFGAIQPISLAHTPTNVTVLYTSVEDGLSALAERRRIVGASMTADVPRPAPSTGTWLRLGPNPLPAGRALVIVGEASWPPAAIEIFDVSGRRVAELPVESAGGRFTARLASDRMTHWPGGVYFARARGAPGTARFVLLR